MKKSRKVKWIGVLFLLVVTLFILKPKKNGKPYTPYFSELNKELKKQDIGRPVILIDLDLLDSNIAVLKSHIQAPKSYRVVDKSLPSFGLIDYIFEKTGTYKVMCFHQPFLNLWALHHPQVDLLLGKPMPFSALSAFYTQLPDSATFVPSRQLQWLIDTKERLLEYQEFTHRKNLKLRLNVEIDVGLHRGGVQNAKQLQDIYVDYNRNNHCHAGRPLWGIQDPKCENDPKTELKPRTW